MRSRRAQITLWVILGIVFLILVSLLLVLFRRPYLSGIDTLPSDFTPVQDHILDCVEAVAITGLKEMASHGGYMYPNDIEWTGQELKSDMLNPTESDLLLANKADINSGVPYYYYMRGPNDCNLCLMTTLTPPIEKMDAQLERYILENLPECVNFGNFPDIEVDASDIDDVTVTIQDESVLVEYQRKLTLSHNGQSVTARNFPVLLDVPFGRYYKTAKAITQKEIDTQFLENYLMYLISAYSGIETDLPPIAGFEEGHNIKFWTLFPVKQRVQQILYSTTPMLQVLETAGVSPPTEAINDPYIRSFFEMTYLDLIDDPELHVEDFDINIFYLNDPIYLDVRPRKGELIEPRTERTSGILIFPSRQQNYYNFFYDISAPFLIEVRDENATQNTDFSFLFALEANVRDNKNIAEWLMGRGTIPWSYDVVGYDLTDPSETDPSSPLSNPDATLPSYMHNRSVESFFCEPSQRQVPLTVQVFDGGVIPSQPLQDVEFTFNCGRYDSCFVGYSEFDDFGIYSRLKTELPICIGGQLKARKEGYQTKIIKVSTEPGHDVALPAITLDPFIERDVRVVKQVFKENVTLLPHSGYSREEYYSGEENITANDTVIITMTLLESDDEEPYTTSAFFSNSSDDYTKLKLVPGIYEVSVQYLDNRGFVIPGAEVPPPPHRLCDRYVENDTNITPAPIGGLELSADTRYFQVERTDLYENNQLVIPLFVFPTPLCIMDLERLGEAKKYTRENYDKAMPYFENVD